VATLAGTIAGLAEQADRGVERRKAVGERNSVGVAGDRGEPLSGIGAAVVRLV